MTTLPIADDRARLLFRVALAEGETVTGVPVAAMLGASNAEKARAALVAVNLAVAVYDGPTGPEARVAMRDMRHLLGKRIVADADAIVERLKLKLAPAPDAAWEGA